MTTFFKAKLLSEQTLTEEIALFTFEYPENTDFNYQAGQYIHMQLPNGQTAPLSIANAPNQSTLTFHLRHNQDIAQHALANHILETLRRDKTMTFSGPIGKCTLQNTATHIFLAGGTGFAPIQALLEMLEKKHSVDNIYLYWGVKKPEDCYALEYITKIKKTLPQLIFKPILSQAKPSGNIIDTGLVHELFIKDFINSESTLKKPLFDINHTAVYASGPYPMIMALKNVFITEKLSLSFLFSDMLN